MKVLIRIRTLLSLVIILFVSLSCSKKRDEITIDETNLTSCRDNFNCQYRFSIHADLSEDGQRHTSGDYRLFWASEQGSGISSLLYIKAPMQGDKFMLTDDAILNGKVQLVTTCAVCFSIPFKPVGGYVKGINLTPDKEADQTKWLLEAKIVLQTDGEPVVKDTLNIKQYFYPNFVFN